MSGGGAALGQMETGHPINIDGTLDTASPRPERRADRAKADLEAGLRQRGAGAVSIKIVDLSTTGFRASTHLDLLTGTEVWLKLPGLESLPSKVVWMDGDLIGCQFVRPLHPAVLANILRASGAA